MGTNTAVTHRDQFGKPTGAFVGAAWAALALAVIVYFVSLWRADMDSFEKGSFSGRSSSVS